MRSNILLRVTLGLAVAGAPIASATDYWDVATDNDNSGPGGTDNELVHGTSQQHDLQANPGPVADEDWYSVTNHPRSSYEVVIDSASGDLDMPAPAENFQRLDIDGLTVLQTGENANGFAVGTSVALRWQHLGTTTDLNFLRVRSAACGLTCGAEDQYHIRSYDTTIAVPRFNNAGGQITVLIVQNPTGWTRDIGGSVYFWSGTGTLLGSTTFSLAAKAGLVLNTSTVPGVAAQAGTMTIAHDGGYGNLTAKSVALEPSTGFSFDSPGTYKPL
jgi:hypothetical protein